MGEVILCNLNWYTQIYFMHEMSLQYRYDAISSTLYIHVYMQDFDRSCALIELFVQ